MTFLEAAIEILRQTGKPLSVKELTERAVKQNLLSVVGRAPEATMKNRLTEELAKARTTLIKVGANQFGLARYDRPAAPAVVMPAAEAVGADAERSGRRRRRRGGRGRRRGGEAGEAGEAGETAPQPEVGTPEEAIAAEQLAEEAEAVEVVEAVDIDAFQPQSQPRRGHVEMPSDESLAADYAEELEEGTPVAVEPEPAVDEKSADEDRPMLAPIQAERDRGRDRRRGPRGLPRERRSDEGERERQGLERRKERERLREERRKARDQKKEPRREPRPEDARREPRREEPRRQPVPIAVAQPARVSQPLQPPPAAVIAAGTPADAAGDTLADIAHNLLRSLNDPRPIHARQIVAMALKRKMAAGDPEDLFRAIRAALLDDARARQGRGLRPRVRHHGGSLFALATSRVDPELAAAEQALAERASALAEETRFAVRRRLSQLPHMALEQLARVYLERTGWREVTLVKRVETTTYLSARIRRGALNARTLVGVRAGAEEIGRRAIGELRAGVAAKGQDDAMLIAAASLSEEGEREVRAPGPWITLLDADAFADELIRAGVGLLRVAMPIAYLDADFFVELVQS